MLFIERARVQCCPCLGGLTVGAMSRLHAVCQAGQLNRVPCPVSSVHQVNKCRTALTDNKIIEQVCVSFASSAMLDFPAVLDPINHALVNHCIAWLGRWSARLWQWLQQHLLLQGISRLSAMLRGLAST